LNEGGCNEDTRHNAAWNEQNIATENKNITSPPKREKSYSLYPYTTIPNHLWLCVIFGLESTEYNVDVDL